MKKVIIGFVLGVLISAGSAVAATTGFNVVYNKAGIRCLDTSVAGTRALACGLSNGHSYKIGINKYVVAVSAPNGEVVYSHMQPAH